MFKKLLFCLGAIMVSVFVPLSAHAGECQLYETTHLAYPLDGAHLQGGKCTVCASCHTNATFIGTPKTCDACHASSGLRASVYKSTAHFSIATMTCDTCHNTSSYTATWSMTHSALPNGVRCDSCHNGSYEAYNAHSKADFVSSSSNPVLTTHMTTTSDCNTCHTPPTSGMRFPITAWQNVSISAIHSGLTLSSTCSTCHNGTNATGKNSATTGTGGIHPVTSLECGACHSFAASFKCAQAYDIMKNYAFLMIEKVKVLIYTTLA